MPWYMGARDLPTTSADKLPGTCTRVPDVPAAKVEDLWMKKAPAPKLG